MRKTNINFGYNEVLSKCRYVSYLISRSFSSKLIYVKCLTPDEQYHCQDIRLALVHTLLLDCMQDTHWSQELKTRRFIFDGAAWKKRIKDVEKERFRINTLFLHKRQKTFWIQQQNIYYKIKKSSVSRFWA